jgi:hypothetical protein
VDCKWGEFTQWTTCNQTCGTGGQTRERVVEREATKGGANCTGSAKEIQECVIIECPGN